MLKLDSGHGGRERGREGWGAWMSAHSNRDPLAFAARKDEKLLTTSAEVCFFSLPFNKTTTLSIVHTMKSR